MRLSVYLGLVAIAVLGLTGHCAVFEDDFSGGLSSQRWLVTMTTAGMYSVDATHGDIRLAKIAPTPGGYQDVEINLNIDSLTPTGYIAGDFDVQVDFRDANISGGGLNQVELHTGYVSGAIFYDVRDRGNVHVWNGGERGGLSTNATAGRFRISRVGSTVTGYFNGQPIWSSGSYSAALSWVAFSLQNNASSNDPISVTFDNFSISAPEAFPATVAPKLLADGKPLTLDGYIATTGGSDAVDYFYAEAPDRHEGIRIATTPGVVSGLARGSIMTVSGNMATTAAGEREIVACSVTATPSELQVRPLAMPNRSIGGANLGIAPLAQYGVDAGSGLNNVGLLISTCGKVTDVDTGYLVIDDGSGSPVRVDTSFVSSQPAKGSFATVAGISSLYRPDALRQRLLVPCSAVDWYVVNREPQGE